MATETPPEEPEDTEQAEQIAWIRSDINGWASLIEETETQVSIGIWFPLGTIVDSEPVVTSVQVDIPILPHTPILKP